MNLIDLLENQTSETDCKQAFKEHRELLGVTCKKCQSKNQRWNENKESWQCHECNFRTTLRSGTSLQHSKMPFKIWFQVVAFMISTKKGFSAKEIQKQTKHKRYQPIWYMMHKIRTQMGGNVQYFDAFEHLLADALEGIKQTSCSDKSATNLCEIQIETVSFKRFNEEGNAMQTNGIRMNLIDQSSQNNRSLKKMNTVLRTFGKTPEKPDSKRKIKARSSARFAYKCLANLRRVIFGIHHQVKLEYLQNYLDEFCYKFNRKSLSRDGYNEIWQYLILPVGYGCGYSKNTFGTFNQ